MPYSSYRMAIAITSDTGRSPADALDDFASFYFDTALSSSTASLPTLLAFAKPGHITFGSDWPFAPVAAGKLFAAGLETYPGLDDTARQAMTAATHSPCFRASPRRPRLLKDHGPAESVAPPAELPCAASLDSSAPIRNTVSSTRFLDTTSELCWQVRIRTCVGEAVQPSPLRHVSANYRPCWSDGWSGPAFTLCPNASHDRKCAQPQPAGRSRLAYPPQRSRSPAGDRSESGSPVQLPNTGAVTGRGGPRADYVPKYSWIWRIAIDPSPTAEATRLTEPLRTSPAANTPGWLVSSIIG